MGQKMDVADLKKYAETNHRLANLAEEQGNRALARELAAIAREAEAQLASLRA